MPPLFAPMGTVGLKRHCTELQGVDRYSRIDGNTLEKGNHETKKGYVK